MSPINATPLRGYQDWQRVDNWDQDLILNVTTPGNGNPFASGVLDVSRFACIGGSAFVQTNNVLLSFTWYSDAAGTNQVGVRNIMLSPSITQTAQLRILNLGPFVKITASSPGLAVYTLTVQMFGTNRVFPLEFYSQDPIIYAISGLAIGATTAVSEFPAQYYAGPVKVYCISAAGNVVYTAQMLTPANAVRNISLSILPAANTIAELAFVAPPGVWWIVVNNTGAATSFSLSCVPSMTGSI